MCEVGPRGRKQQQRCGDVTRQPFDQLQQRRFGPVHVLDEQDDWTVARLFRQEVDPRGVEPVPRGEWMEVACDVEAEREAEDLAVAEPSPGRLRWVALEDSEMLFQRLSEGPQNVMPSP
jgi:hypothetical protein